jgi:choice-of-anchor B domain-containing protein
MSSRFGRFLILAAITLFSLLMLAWQNRLLANSNPTGGAAPCDNGLADIYPCRNVNLLSFVSKEELGAPADMLVTNLWGWTDPDTSKEYVLLGLQDGTAFLDISDPLAPVYLGTLPTHSMTATLSPYRDMKVYENYAFIIADTTSRNGMQIFDLTNLRGITSPVTFSETAHYPLDANPANSYAHNIFIHEDTGYAYAVRNAAHCTGGAMIIDLQDPLNPADAGCFEESGAASDTVCVLYHGPDPAYQGREICALASDDDLIIGDVTSKTAPITLETLSYVNAERIHHAWFTEDHSYLLSVDMDDEHHHGLNTRIFIWDMSDLDNIPAAPQIYNGPTTGSDHNLWIIGDYAYIGNLSAGLRILDLSRIDEGQVTEAAYFDDYPPSDAAGHLNGAWAVYAYFESGVVAISDRQEGLFLVKPLLERVHLPVMAKN